MTLAQAQARYGAIVNGHWADEAKWCGFVTIPAGIRLVNSATGQVMTRIYCNGDMAHPLKSALESVAARGLAHELETFGGCLMIRDVRAEPGHPSTHSYALAVDFNEHKFPLGSSERFSDGFVACFKEQGFSYGGDFHRKDPMHYSFAWE